MRFDLRFSMLPLCLAAALAGCAAGTPALPNGQAPSLSIAPGGGCRYSFVSTGIQPPINADSSSSFQLGRTVPVKITFTDCTTGAPVDALTPTISLLFLGTDSLDVNEVVSSSAADSGNVMRPAGNGQYIFNLSTKRSQFNAGQDLIPGTYELTIWGSSFADVLVKFAIRP